MTYLRIALQVNALDKTAKDTAYGMGMKDAVYAEFVLLFPAIRILIAK